MAGEAIPVSATPVHFTEAIDYFRSKVNLPTNSWSDLMHQAHTRAFTVAGATSDALLVDFRAALDRAISTGGTLETFRADFDRIVAQHGWAYHGSRNWRSRLIFEMNTRMAYSSGRWQQAQRLKATRPYGRYVDVHDARTRPEHYAWHDIILPIDHPWWRTHWPPNGWNCRCHAQTLAERDLTRYGLKVTLEPPAIEMEPREVRAPDGSIETVWTPKGIDTGFGYNPGESWLRGVTPAELRKPLQPASAPPAPSTPGAAGPATGGAPPAAPTLPATAPPSAPTLPPLPAAPGPNLPLLPPGQPEEVYVNAFLNRFGASVDNPVVWRDPSGTRLVISDELFRNAQGELKATKFGRAPYLEALAEALYDPDEIWVDWLDIAEKGQPPVWALRRRYLRRLALDGRAGSVASFEWTSKGWAGTAVFQPDRESYLNRQRTGALLYMRS